MNGKTPPAPTMPPPSVQHARRHQQQPRAWTGLWRGRILGALFILALLGVVAAQIITRTQGKIPKAAGTAESTLEPMWGRQTFQYKPEEPPAPPAPPPPPPDTTKTDLAMLRSEVAQMRQQLDDLKNRKPPTSSAETPRPARKTPIPQSTPAPMLFVSHDRSKETTAQQTTVPEYVLAPGTFLPCEVETTINSDVEGPFTARVTQNIYDTGTRRHLLVSQGSIILGNTQSSQLIYGSERLNTISLTLTLADGRSVGLGNAPVTDQAGTTGMGGDVDNHYGRLVGAVFIGGALKGGMSAISTAANSAAGAGQVASGIAGMGSQVTTQTLSPVINIRPTIKPYVGQLCNVLLIKPLSLPAMWQ